VQADCLRTRSVPESVSRLADSKFAERHALVCPTAGCYSLLNRFLEFVGVELIFIDLAWSNVLGEGVPCPERYGTLLSSEETGFKREMRYARFPGNVEFLVHRAHFTPPRV